MSAARSHCTEVNQILMPDEPMGLGILALAPFRRVRQIFFRLGDMAANSRSGAQRADTMRHPYWSFKTQSQENRDVRSRQTALSFLRDEDSALLEHSRTVAQRIEDGW
jgi:hypothetical protein